MARDILIVEDDQTVLSIYGMLVKMNLGVEPFLAETSQKALEIMKNYPLKVLVTDYDMSSTSDISGLELVKQMKGQLKLNIPCILITGYTSVVSAEDVICAGFLTIIDNNESENKIIPAIRRAIEIYNEISRNKTLLEVNQVIWSKEKKFTYKEKVHLKLLRISSINNNLFFDDEWSTDYIAERGICKTTDTETEHEATSSIEYGFNEQVLGELGFDSDKIINAVHATVGTKLDFSIKGQFKKVIKHKVKYSTEIKDLIDEPITVQGLVLKTRHYQSAPVYNRINCVFQIDCSFCGIPRILDLSIIVPTNKIALRQVEYYDKGAPKKIYTGFATSTIL
jgi:FixJ family two-component response regulator